MSFWATFWILMMDDGFEALTLFVLLGMVVTWPSRRARAWWYDQAFGVVARALERMTPKREAV